MSPATSASVPTGNTYDKYATAHPIERRLLSGFFTALHAALPDDRPSRILEVGIGEAEVSNAVAERYDREVVGVDLPDPELAALWSGKPVAAVFADIADLPFGDDKFDLVLAIEVLEHVPDPAAALRDIGRVGSRDIVLSVPREPIWRLANMARGRYWKDLGNTPGHIQHWGTRAFTALVAAHLDVVAVSKPFPWTMVRAVSR